MTSHHHQCDCDACLNGAGGYKVSGMGVVTRAPEYEIVQLEKERERARCVRYRAQRKAKRKAVAA